MLNRQKLKKKKIAGYPVVKATFFFFFARLKLFYTLHSTLSITLFLFLHLKE
jgi:hypothetical protein